jgi:hypothetical protein
MMGAKDPSEMPLKTKQTARHYMPRGSNTELHHQHSLEIFAFSNVRNFSRTKQMEWQKSAGLPLLNI